MTGTTDTASIPATVTLNVCPKCGRTNRVTDLPIGKRWHFSGGVRCYGIVEAVTYVRALPATTTLTDHDLETIADTVGRSLRHDDTVALLRARVLDALHDRFDHRTAPTEG